MATYTLNIDLDAGALKTLKDNGYMLCIAKKVNGLYNVVWKGDKFMEHNSFDWVEQYQVFAASSFADSSPIKSASGAVPIEYGQTATLDKYGLMNPAAGPTTGTSFDVDNEYDLVYLGVNSCVNGSWLPIFVDPQGTVEGTETFTPVVSILAWFDRNLKTSTMFTHAVSKSTEVVYGNTTTQSYSYIAGNSGSGAWIKGSVASGLQFFPDKTYHPLSNTFEDTAGPLDLDLIQQLSDKFATLYFPKRQVSVTIPPFIVQAILTYAVGVSVQAACTYFRTHLAAGTRVSVEYDGPTRTVTVKIGWAVAAMKESIRGDNDVQKLEKLFTGVAESYVERYDKLVFSNLVLGKGLPKEEHKQTKVLGLQG